MTARWSTRTFAVLALAVLCLAACGGDDDASGAATSTTTTDATTTTSEPAETTTVPDEPATEPSSDVPEDPGEGDGLGDPLVFVADLSGETEVPGPGDAGGTGRAEIESAVAGEWCIEMSVTGLSAEVTDAHIHFGPAGNSGDVVIPIGTPTEIDGDTDVWDDVCVPVEDDLAAEILDAPEAFYANVHTAEFGAGAVRGQLQSATIFDLTLS